MLLSLHINYNLNSNKLQILEIKSYSIVDFFINQTIL